MSHIIFEAGGVLNELILDYVGYHKKTCTRCRKLFRWGYSEFEPFPICFRTGIAWTKADVKYVCQNCANVPNSFICDQLKVDCCLDLRTCILCTRFVNTHMTAPCRINLMSICLDCDDDLATLRQQLRANKRLKIA